MVNVIAPLTSFVWYGPTLILSGDFDWKARIKTLRVINPAGAGYNSWVAGRPANSLTAIKTGAVVTLDAAGLVSSNPTTHFQVDNGSSAALMNPELYEAVSATSDELVTENFSPLVFFNRVAISLTGVASASDLSSVSVVVEAKLNNGGYQSLAATSAAILALSAADVASSYTVALRVTKSAPVMLTCTTAFSYS